MRAAKLALRMKLAETEAAVAFQQRQAKLAAEQVGRFFASRLMRHAADAPPRDVFVTCDVSSRRPSSQRWRSDWRAWKQWLCRSRSGSAQHIRSASAARDAGQDRTLSVQPQARLPAPRCRPRRFADIFVSFASAHALNKCRL